MLIRAVVVNKTYQREAVGWGEKRDNTVVYYYRDMQRVRSYKWHGDGVVREEEENHIHKWWTHGSFPRLCGSWSSPGQEQGGDEDSYCQGLSWGRKMIGDSRWCDGWCLGWDGVTRRQDATSFTVVRTDSGTGGNEKPSFEKVARKTRFWDWFYRLNVCVPQNSNANA